MRARLNTTLAANIRDAAAVGLRGRVILIDGEPTYMLPAGDLKTIEGIIAKANLIIHGAPVSHESSPEVEKAKADLAYWLPIRIQGTLHAKQAKED